MTNWDERKLFKQQLDIIKHERLSEEMKAQLWRCETNWGLVVAKTKY